MNVFATRILPEAGLEKLLDAGLSVSQWQEKRDMTAVELIHACQSADALLSAGTKLDAHVLQQCKHLKVISLHSVGYDSIDLAEATRLKIPVGNTPGVLSGTTADIAFFLMMAVSRKAFFHYQRIQKGDWHFFEPTAHLGVELHGKTLGVFGLGEIGYEMAKRCQLMYQMNIIYCNRHSHVRAETTLQAQRVSFEELLAESDVLSVHAPLSQETREVFNWDAFRQMKSSSIFINTARGAIHQEKDLTEALKQGAIWGAGLDVTHPEPMLPGNPLLSLPNVAVLPHIGSATVETRNAMSLRAADNIIAGLKGERLPYSINPELYEEKS